MRCDDHALLRGSPNRAGDPVVDRVAEGGVRDARVRRGGGVLGRMVGAADDRDRRTAHDDSGRAPSLGKICARARRRDPRVVQHVQRVEQRVVAVVECVIVRERHDGDAEPAQRIHRDRRRSEEERLAGIGPTLAARRDAALQIGEHGIGFGQHGDQVVGEQGVGPAVREHLGDTAARASRRRGARAPCDRSSRVPHRRQAPRVFDEAREAGMVCTFPVDARTFGARAEATVPASHRCRRSCGDLLFGGVAQHAVAGKATREGCKPVAEIEATQHLDELGLRFDARAPGSRVRSLHA